MLVIIMFIIFIILKQKSQSSEGVELIDKYISQNIFTIINHHSILRFDCDHIQEVGHLAWPART